MNRREFAVAPLAVAACGQKKPETGWPARWDRVLLERAVKALDERFDPEWMMIRAVLGPEYRYHTKLRECRAHPTRDSFEYALLLLERGLPAQVERARRILDRVLSLQVTDPESKWYGIWGWYAEEPPDRMSPADWNWADFNGSLLLLAELRQSGMLGEDLRKRVREAIGHAARSVQRRNVPMSYTNIAAMGTFVTLAAGELLGDEGLSAYARERLVRFAQQIDGTGSIAEYNSPTYARVTLTNLTRIRMYVKDPEAKRRAALIENRLWLHMAEHWDARRRQFAGPMSRSYSNDTGQPAWLEKALQGKLGLANPDNRTGIDGETPIHDYRSPAHLASRFLAPGEPREHRELFIAKPPTSGVTYFSRDFSLGSVNRGDFWIQRRPLLAYFGDASRPPRVVQMRAVKDGYDFCSALFHSVQEKGRVLGLVTFRDPGGDKHPSLDPIKNGEFDCGRLFLELRFEELERGFQFSMRDGVLEVRSSRLMARLRGLAARFGSREAVWSAATGERNLTATLDFKPVGAPKRVRWGDVREAYAAFALELADGGASFSEEPFAVKVEAGRIRVTWGRLELRGLTRVAAVAEHDAEFEELIGGKPAPLNRLSDELLA